MPHAPVTVRSIPSQRPEEVARILSHKPFLAFLDSGKAQGGLGRYSYVACDPFGVLKIANGAATWNGTALEENPLEALKTLLNRFSLPTVPDLPPFQTGAIGFIAYEFGRYIENHLNIPKAVNGIPDMMFGFYDAIFAHDHQTDHSMIVSSGWPETDPDLRAARAEDRINQFIDDLSLPQEKDSSSAHITEWQSNFTRETYRSAVNHTIEHILAGDIFQANIAQRFTATLPDGYSPLAFYHHLRSLSPATFGAYLGFDGIAIASNSPERFLSMRDHQVEARPIKGTAPRDDAPEKDRALAEALLSSTKDRAENTMIVDLLRNDLSRVCEPHSVKVPVLCGLESYASVHHLVSVVTGTLADPFDGVDLIKATFPGGSITGAPKIKAMDIIGAIEQVPRGVYCGSIGYMGFDGTMDLNIAIRTVTFGGETVSFHAGGAITTLSEADAEYDETLTKAERIFRAFGATGPVEA